MNTLILKWWYSSQSSDAVPYEYRGTDSAQIGRLFRLKSLEPAVIKLELWRDNFLVISYTKQEGGD